MPAIEPTAVYTAAEVAGLLRVDRSKVDAACTTGRLPAADAKSETATKHRWRIEGADALDWKRAGFPTTTT